MNQRIYTITYSPQFGVDLLRVICTDIWKLEYHLESMLSFHVWEDTKQQLEQIDDLESLIIELPHGSYEVRALECDKVIDIHI